VIHLVALLACTGAARPPETAPEARMDPLATIALLADLHPYVAAEVASRLAVHLEETPASNAYFSVWAGPGAGGVTRVEVREPTLESPGRGGLVVLEVAPEPCIARSEVGDRFGPPAAEPPRPPSPTAPPGQPTYVTHPQPWGEIRLGYAPGGCLVRAVLEAR
jgi:hypothetical protein